MAKPVKQLRELLQEKQEPFILELYLVEKGCFRKTFNSRKSLEICNLVRSQRGIPQYSKVLRAVYNQVVSLNERLRIKSSNPRDVAVNKERNNQETAELDRFSSASCSTVLDSSTSQQKENITIRVTEVVTDRNRRCQCIEESKQLSPVSVLQEVASNRDGTANSSSTKQKNGTNNCKVTEDSILSASLWKILFQSAREKSILPGVSEIQDLVHSNLSRRNLKSKKVLQQTRHLLFDCVREIVETQERRKKKQQQQQQQREFLAREEFGKLIEEKIKCWGKQYGEESNSAHLLELGLRNSAPEWIGYKPQERKIGREIGDAILDDIMSEIVMDMVDF